MTEHDRIRKEAAEQCDRNSIDSVQDAIRGLQSTDDPSLNELHDELQARLRQLQAFANPRYQTAGLQLWDEAARAAAAERQLADKGDDGDELVTDAFIDFPMLERHWYVLDGHEVREVADVREWAERFEDGESRIVKQEQIGPSLVSTVFLGINHSWAMHGPPLLFETMVFGGGLSDEQDRCSTWAEAEAMHAEMCERVRNTRRWWWPLWPAYNAVYCGIRRVWCFVKREAWDF